MPESNGFAFKSNRDIQRVMRAVKEWERMSKDGQKRDRRLKTPRGGRNVPDKVVDLDGSLSAGGSATGSIYEWTGSAWTDTTENMTVRDFRTSGDAIASGSRCVVTKMYGEWWVIATECPA